MFCSRTYRIIIFQKKEIIFISYKSFVVSVIFS